MSVRACRLLALMAGVILLASCGGESASVETTASTTASTAVSTTTTTTALPSPDDGSGRVLFSGTEDCGFEGLEETTEGPLTTYVGRIVCTLDTSDPRATGQLTAEITMVFLNMPGFEVNKWWASGTGTLTNDGGSWRLTEAFGADVWDETGKARTTGTEGYVGEGGYVGLRMRVLMAQGTNEPVNAYVVAGWIEPAE